MTETTEADDDGSLMNTLEALAGEGRIPVEDRTSPEDPRLNIKTPEGIIKTGRTPDSVRKEGSSTLRRWNWGPYQLEEDRDWQSGLEHNHAIEVKKRDNTED